MKIDLIIQNGGTIFYPAVAEDITLEWVRAGSPGKLTFSAVRDEILKVEEGNAVKLTVDGTDIFYGFVFTKSSSGRNRHLIDITAYDQLRYFRNKDTYVYANKKASEVIRMIAEDFRLRVGTLDDTGYIIPSRTEDNATLFDVAQNALDETLKARTRLFVLYDDVGRLTLRDVENMKLNLLIDADTGGDYSYSSSIDSQTYNQIKITCDNEDTGNREVFLTRDSANINRWGLLQYTDTVEKTSNGIQKAEALLKLYNQKTRKLSVSDVLGDIRVRAGSSVLVQLTLEDVQIQGCMLVEKVTHRFNLNQHLMDLKLRGGTFVT